MPKRRRSQSKKLNASLKSHRPRGETRTLRRSVFYCFKEAMGISKREFRFVRNAHRHHSYDGGRRPLERKHSKGDLKAAALRQQVSVHTECLEMHLG